MTSRSPQWIALLAAGLLAACTQTPRITEELGPDGLLRVERSGFDQAYVKPNLDISGYKKVLIEEIAFEYRPGEPRGAMPPNTPSPEEAKTRLVSILRKAFAEEINQGARFQLVNEPGQDVLALRPSLLDVTTSPRMGVGPDIRFYVDRVGAGTLVLELRDSLKGTLLARATDRRAAQRTDVSSPAETRPDFLEVEEVAKLWARLARQRLEGLAALPPQAK